MPKKRKSIKTEKFFNVNDYITRELPVVDKKKISTKSGDRYLILGYDKFTGKTYAKFVTEKNFNNY